MLQRKFVYLLITSMKIMPLFRRNTAKVGIKHQSSINQSYLHLQLSSINFKKLLINWLGFMVFNVTFNNISVISWRSVLLVDDTRVPGENHQPVAVIETL
jgi:hypothetical protein